VLKSKLRAGDTAEVWQSIECSGECCERLGPEAIQRLLAICVEREIFFKVTRVDAAFDHCPFTPIWFADQIEAGRLRSRGERKTLSVIRKPFGDEDDPAGNTAYFGVRGSNHFICCYDKRGFTRLELRLGKTHAAMVGYRMCKVPVADWKMFFAEELRCFIDLVDREPGENVTRASDKLLPLWAELLAGIERIKYVVGGGVHALLAQAQSVWRLLERKKKAAARTVAQLIEGLGFDGFLDFARSVEFQERDAPVVRAIREQLQVFPVRMSRAERLAAGFG
jgi:hypothetical protein